MSSRTLARRYASALFDVTNRQGSAAEADRDLQAIRQLVADHEELGRVFENPAIPAQKKRAIVEALLEKSAGVNDQVRRLLLMLAERDRLGLLADVAAAFDERLMEARRVVAAEVVTAEPLPDAQRTALAAALGKAAESTVTINEKVDPSIVGGIVARVGSVIFDGSITRQLERMRQRLLAGG
jgi:F-type H+-transporting ATPase subunit delta